MTEMIFRDFFGVCAPLRGQSSIRVVRMASLLLGYSPKGAALRAAFGASGRAMAGAKRAFVGMFTTFLFAPDPIGKVA